MYKLMSVGSQSHPGRYGDEEKNCLCPGEITQDHPARSSVTVPAKLIHMPAEVKHKICQNSMKKAFK